MAIGTDDVPISTAAKICFVPSLACAGVNALEICEKWSCAEQASGTAPVMKVGRNGRNESGPPLLSMLSSGDHGELPQLHRESNDV